MPSTQKPWMTSLGNAFNKLSVGLGYTMTSSSGDTDFFPSKPPLDDVEFRNFLDGNGKLIKAEELRLRIYHGGVSPALRKVVWRILLNVFPPQLSGEERIAYMKTKTEEYVRLRQTWQARVDIENVKYISNMVWKDVLRTDRGHPFFQGPDDNPNTVSLMNILTTFALTHPKVSYCQGMSDMLSPIFVIMGNEAQAFVCFCGIMKRLQQNFLKDGTSISTKFRHLSMLVKHYDPEFFKYLQTLKADNMFFCYRWILLEMKREFSFDDAISVLEVMWSSLPPQPPLEDLNLEDYSDEDLHEESDLEGSSSMTSKSKSSSSFEIISDEDSDPRDDDRLQNVIIDYTSENKHLIRNDEDVLSLPPPEEFGCGNPFLLFVCLSLLLDERDLLMQRNLEYDDLVMHFDRKARSHSPRRVLSSAMRLFAQYLKSNSCNEL